MQMNRTTFVNKSGYILIGVVATLLCMLRYQDVGRSASDTEIVVASGLLLLIYVIGIIAWLRVTHRYSSPFFLLLVACFLFNAGQLFLYYFGLSNEGFFNIFSNYSGYQIVRMTYFQAMCVLMAVCGALVSFTGEVGYYVGKGLPIRIEDSDTFSLVDILFGGSAVYLILINLSRVLMRSTISYTEAYYTYTISDGGYITATFTFIFHVSFFCGFYKHYSDKKKRYLYLLVAVVWLLLLLLVGGRFKLIPLIAGIGFIVYMINQYKGSHLKIHSIIILFIIGLFVLSLMEGLATIRNRSLSSLSLSYIIEVYSEGIIENLYATLSEAGASARCIMSTMRYIEEGIAKTEPSFLYALVSGIIPNFVLSKLGWTMDNLSLSAWITNMANSSNGWGYSIFAECYYNLKEYGCIYMFIISFIMVKLECISVRLMRNGANYDKALGCAILYILVDSIFLSRANMLLVSPDIRRTFYLYVIIVFLKRGRARIHCPEEID